MGRTATLGGRLTAAAAALAVGALSTLTLVVVASPAGAEAPAIRLDSPSNAAPLTDPVIHVAGQASMPSGGTVNGQITIEVASLNGHGGQSIGINVSGNPVPFSWDYTTQFNGTYRVTITATGRDPGPLDQTPSEKRIEIRDVVVEVKPGAPTGLTAKVNKGREVALAWNPNPEPDIVGYQVQRRYDGTDTTDAVDWSPVVNTAGTVFTDKTTTTDGGTYHYRVVAVRSSAAGDQGIPSDPSGEQAVAVPNPPPSATTTSTTAANGGSGGAGNGGSGGTGSGGTGTTNSDGTTAGNDPDLARTGKVDLANFRSLLDQAQRPIPKPTSGKAKEDDGTFDESLPFKQGDEAVGEDGTALGVGIHEEGGEAAGRKPIAFVAASLLITVILMHLLWLKREVERGPLPAEAPGN
jgi:hypothetical protein